jgi:archaemetzincin
VKIIKLILIILLFSFCSQNEGSIDDIKNENNNNQKPAVAKKELGEKHVSPQALNIDILPFEGIPQSITDHVFKELSKILTNLNLLKPIALPKRAYYAPRNRYRADTLIYILRNATEDGHVTMGLTNKDISAEKGKVFDYGIMGLAYQPGKSCVVSTYRLSKKNINEQFFKVAIHELGHTQGLPHCPNKTCLMTDAEGKNKTDNESGFCDKCKLFLKGKGWKLN